MYFFLKLLSKCVGKLSARTLDRLAGALAILSFDILRIRRKLIFKNLNIAFGNKKSAAEFIIIGRQSFKNVVLTAFELLRSKQEDIDKSVTFEGKENIDAVLSKGQGCFVLCCHLGNWEAFGAVVGRQIATVHVAVKKVGNDSSDRFVSELRYHNKLFTLPRAKKGDAVRAIREALKRNEIIGFILDQARSGEPRLPFFGADATTNTGLAAMARRFKAPVIPGFIKRVSFGKHHVTFWPELNLAESEDQNSDILENTKMFNKIIEKIVLECPEQYLWLHNRWK